MSSPKFAAMTANLLVRKGEAAPSPLSASSFRSWENNRPNIAAVPPAPPPEPARALSENAIGSAFKAPSALDPLRPRKIIVALSPAQHEVLAIAAVKTGKTRPQMMRDALAAYLTGLARDYGEACPCIAQGARREDARP